MTRSERNARRLVLLKAIEAALDFIERFRKELAELDAK